MTTLRFFRNLTVRTLGELCQRRWLLAELALLCLFLPLLIGPAANSLLGDGVDFSGITLAVTAPEGDAVPELLEQYMGEMQDVSQYCSFLAMDEKEAAEALRAGEVSAILSLPGDLIGGIMDGSNPDVILTVSGDRPLEALLTLWVGQSAADLLSAVQAGIYAVLEIHEAFPADLSREQVQLDINLRYITRTLNRSNIFREETVSATGTLPIDLHYRLSLLAYLGLSAAPLFSGIYSGERFAFRRRLRAAGRGSLICFASDLCACGALLFLLTALPLCLFTKGALLPSLGIALLFSLFCALFGNSCCLVTGSAAAGGGLAFFLSLLATAIGGGILPPVLLPATLRTWSLFSPAVWLRTLAALPGGYAPEQGVLPVMSAATAALLVLSAALYHRRLTGKEAGA